jgi:hypothetical protein
MSDWIVSPRVKAAKQEIAATYDGFAPFYADVTVWEERTRETVIDRAEIREGYRVLDCGCGPGTLVIEAAERAGPSGRVYTSSTRLTSRRCSASWCGSSSRAGGWCSAAGPSARDLTDLLPTYPELAKQVEGIESFVFSSEVLWDTKP